MTTGPGREPIFEELARSRRPAPAGRHSWRTSPPPTTPEDDPVTSAVPTSGGDARRTGRPGVDYGVTDEQPRVDLDHVGSDTCEGGRVAPWAETASDDTASADASRWDA